MRQRDFQNYSKWMLCFNVVDIVPPMIKALCIYMNYNKLCHVSKLFAVHYSNTTKASRRCIVS